MATIRRVALTPLCLAAACSAQEPVSRRGVDGVNAGQLVTRFGGFDPTQDGLPGLLAAQSRKAGSPTAMYALPFADAGAGPSHIVQFTARIDARARALVTDTGAHVRGYMPENALLVDASPGQVDALRRSKDVRSVIVAPALLKVDPRLVRPRGTSMTLDAPTTQQEVVVEVNSAMALAEVDAALRDAGGERMDAALDGAGFFGDHAASMHVRMGAEALLRLATLAEVTGISPHFARHLHNDRAAGMVQSGRIGRTALWDAGLHGEGQVVAVADTGLHTGSCYFGAAGKVLAYQDWAGAGDGDQDGHGTHVAGSIAGANGQDLGLRRFNGMAPAAKLVVQDMAAGTQLVGLNRDLTPILQAAYSAGAHIHSNSWGDEDNSYGPDARAIDRFVAKNRDFLVVIANGNSGAAGEGSVGSPATAKNIISVGAIDASAPERVASFSSRGPTMDSRIKPTLVAPGVNVTSAMHRGRCTSQARSGTSMATPILSGTAALARQWFVEGRYPSGRPRPSDSHVPSSALLRALLIAGADSLRGERDPEIALTQAGYGRVHLDRVLHARQDPVRLVVVDEAYALHTGDNLTLNFSMLPGMPLDVALTWTDPPAAPGAGWALVNDLDLTVTRNGVVMYGNAALSGLESSSLNADAMNVEEVVHLPMAPGGRYEVRVSAPLVPMGPQNFALVVHGAIDGGVTTKMGGR